MNSQPIQLKVENTTNETIFATIFGEDVDGVSITSQVPNITYDHYKFVLECFGMPLGKILLQGDLKEIPKATIITKDANNNTCNRGIPFIKKENDIFYKNDSKVEKFKMQIETFPNSFFYIYLYPKEISSTFKGNIPKFKG